MQGPYYSLTGRQIIYILRRQEVSKESDRIIGWTAQFLQQAIHMTGTTKKQCTIGLHILVL